MTYPIIPRSGFLLAWMPLGKASVCVEYYVEDEAVVEQVVINGIAVGAELFNADIVAGWEDELLRMHKEQREEHREQFARIMGLSNAAVQGSQS